MVSKIIGLAGRSASGKDHVADYIVNRFGYRKKVFATPLRDEFADFLESALTKEAEARGLPARFATVIEHFVKGVYAKPTSLPIRLGLQFWGFDYRVEQDPDYLLDRLKLTPEFCTIISDVRLHSEAALIRKNGGEIWWVARSLEESPVGWRSHPTENVFGPDDCDRILANDQDVYALESKINFIFQFC